MMNGLRLNSEAVPMFPATVLGATNDKDYRIHADFRAFGVVQWYGKDEGNVLGRGDRKPDFINGEHTSPREVDVYRSVDSKLHGEGWKETVSLRFPISKPDEDGDGTVPHRSGIAPKNNARVKSMLKIRAGHEPAYRESMEARRFTLRAIVQIARGVKATLSETDVAGL